MFKLKDLVFYLFLIAITFNGVLNTCPDAELLKPCICKRDGQIFCSNVTGIQMKVTFNRLGESQNVVKQDALIIEGPGCDEVLGNTFDKFSFLDIAMWDAPNLVKIHTNAFNISRHDLKSFRLRNLPALNVNNLFDIINQFEYIGWVFLVELAKLEEIPSLAFKELKYLDSIRLMGPNIKKISEKAFYNLNSLNSLGLINTSLSNIGENIFVFSQKSEKPLNIQLFGNHLMSCNSFSPKTFSEANRPLNLDFGSPWPEYKYSKQMTCLPEQVFRPFFEANSKNDIDLKGMDFNCNNTESFQWLRNITEINSRLKNVRCEGDTNDDHANRVKCPDPELLKPCICKHNENIFCSNVTGIQMKETFNRLGQLQNEVKFIRALVLEGPGCDEVLDNTFDKFSFNDIAMWNAPNLVKIDTNAFNMSRHSLYSFRLRDLPALDVNNLFDIINQFENIGWVNLVQLAKLEEIPSLAFKELKYLDNIRLVGPNIKKINEKAFYNLNSLNSLDIINTSLSNIGENIFVFSKKSEITLKIELYGNHLMSCNSFSPKTFSEANRPLLLNFGASWPKYKYSKQMTCLPEDVFRPFFEANIENSINLKDMDFNCNNTESFQWLGNVTNMNSRVMNLRCEGQPRENHKASYERCPRPELLKPCKCERDGYIFCSNVTGIQLKETFNKLGQRQNEGKVSRGLVLKGEGCDQVLDNTFDKFSFIDIAMWDAPNLVKIDTNAFKKSSNDIYSFRLSRLTSLDLTNLFDIINGLKYVGWVNLVELAKLEEIPSLAFKELKYLNMIRLMGPNIKKINEKPFYNLNSLKSLDIINTSLSNIGENIFVFRQESEQRLEINLFGNKLMDCNSFSPQTFSKANRPLKLNFGSLWDEYKYNKQMTCLPEKVFRPFFEANTKNTIDLKEMDFDCNNCESVWLRNATQYHQRLLNIKCENGNNLDDTDNFKAC